MSYESVVDEVESSRRAKMQESDGFFILGTSRIVGLIIGYTHTHLNSNAFSVSTMHIQKKTIGCFRNLMKHE